MLALQSKRLITILLSTAFLLCIPLIAMQFTTEVQWSLFDFAVAGGLLSGAGLGLELAIRKTAKLPYRVVACFAVVLMLLLVWIELAVGLFGTPFAGS